MIARKPKFADSDQELNHHASRLGRAPSTDEVIDIARDPDSTLHDRFEWDLEKAARQAWTQTAGRILRMWVQEWKVESVYEGPVHVTFSDRVSRASGYSYELTTDVVASSPQRLVDELAARAEAHQRMVLATFMPLYEKVSGMKVALQALDDYVKAVKGIALPPPNGAPRPRRPRGPKPAVARS